MTGQLNYDRFLPLADLTAYPGNRALDRTIQLLWTEDPRRHVWLLAADETPTIQIADAFLEVQKVSEGPPRWLDYGIVDMSFMAEPYSIWDGLVQVRFEGLSAATCASAYLVITTELDVSLEGCTLAGAQRRLWGLAQEDVGRTTVQPSRMTAGEPAHFQACFTAGPRGLPAGACIRFAVPKVFSRPQCDDRDAPGFTEIVAADALVTIAAIRDMLETHEKTTIICRLDEQLPAGSQLQLSYQTAQTFIYPTVLSEVEMRTWYSNLPPLTASVALSSNHPFVNMLPEHGHALTLTPGSSERLHLFLPGRRLASDALELRGLFTDRYRNVPPTGPIDADFELWLVGGPEQHNLGRPSHHFTARHRFAMALPQLTPGVYRVEARRPSSNAVLGRSNPLEVLAAGQGNRLYWGEIHCHTELGDGSGDFDNVFRHAREEGCLDFATVSEHAEYISDNQWEWMQDVTNTWNEPGRFVTLVGYEFIGLQRDRIVYTARPRLELFRGNDPAGNSLDKVWGHFHGDHEVVGGPHATLVHDTRWAHHDPSVERFIEVYSMWGACDFRHGPLVAHWIEEGRGLTANEILATGAKLGFTAGGDCHDGRVGFTSEDPHGQGKTPHTFSNIILYRCGLTAANMLSLDRQHLIGALRDRHTYATTGARILLDFSAAGVPMGGEGRAATVVCVATIHAVSPLQSVHIVKDGELVWTMQLEGLDASVRWRDPESPAREHYYYLSVVQQDGQQAWSSPVWISPRTSA